MPPYMPGIPPNLEGIQLNEPNKRPPETETQKRKAGRPRKAQQNEMPSEPMLIDKEFKRPHKPGAPESKKQTTAEA